MPPVITDTVLLHYSLLLVQRTITLPWGIHAYVEARFTESQNGLVCKEPEVI